MPGSGMWLVNYRDWVFRGHADANWALVPTALREQVSWEPWSTGKGPRASNESQRLIELDVMREFYRNADEQGLPIPGDGPEFRRAYFTHLSGRRFGPRAAAEHGIPGRLDEAWPHEDIWELSALAQHYGLPTQLLDWSRSPLISAYFAAEGAVRMDREGGLLCVWGLNTEVIEAQNLLRREERYLHLVTAPMAGNPNLKAQKGLFTLYRPFARDPDAPPDCRPLEALLEAPAHHPAFKPNVFEGRPWLWKLQMEAGQAKELLRLLAGLRISANAVFPGFGGAAEAVRERRLLK